jgi:hypothetical protein
MAGPRLKMCDSRRWVYIHASCIVLECGFGNQCYLMQGIEKSGFRNTKSIYYFSTYIFSM